MNKLSILALTTALAGGMVHKIAYAENKWTRLYAGVNSGILINDLQLKSQQLGFTNSGDTCNISSHFSSFSAGLQLGYLYQFSQFVVAGLEANVAFNTNQKETLICQSTFNAQVYDGFTLRNRMQTSGRGRLGYSFYKNTILPYFTAGASFVDVDLSYKNEASDEYSTHNMKAGWLVGAGVEWAFQTHWSLRAEYYYADYGIAMNLKIPIIYGLVDPNGNARADLSTNNILLSLNYQIF